MDGKHSYMDSLRAYRGLFHMPFTKMMTRALKLRERGYISRELADYHITEIMSGMNSFLSRELPDEAYIECGAGIADAMICAGIGDIDGMMESVMSVEIVANQFCGKEFMAMGGGVIYYVIPVRRRSPGRGVEEGLRIFDIEPDPDGDRDVYIPMPRTPVRDGDGLMMQIPGASGKRDELLI